MNKYQYDFINGHIIARSGDNRFLLDTGAPQSIGTGVFNFENLQFPLQDSYMGLTVSALSDLVGHPFEVLMGADVISRFDLQIDPVEQCVSFGAAIEGAGEELKTGALMGVPIIECSLPAQSIKAFFDTGARLSYLIPGLLESLEPIGKEADFYPGIGKFETEVYELPVAFAGRETRMKFGILPGVLAPLLGLAGVRGIVGTQLLDDYSCVLSIRNSRLFLKELS